MASLAVYVVFGMNSEAVAWQGGSVGFNRVGWRFDVTLLHVLGGTSLLIGVGVSTVVRAGIGLDYRAVPQDAARSADVVVEWGGAYLCDAVGVPVSGGPPGHLRDRMRP